MKFGLLGHKIAYSLSPVIHGMIARADIEYDIIDLAPEELKDKLLQAASGLSGFNITIPHKQAIMSFCHELDPVAEKIGAVNTVDIKGKKWKGYNTDYLGFIRTIKENIPDHLSYHPLMIGYGGVARAVAFGLDELGYTACSVVGGECENERNAFLKDISSSLNMNMIDIVPDLPILWINCTPVGGAKIPNIPEGFISLKDGDILYDLNYTPYPTHLETYALERNIPTLNGMKMLVCQAMEAQKIWMNNNKNIDTDVDSIIHSIVDRNTVS